MFHQKNFIFVFILKVVIVNIFAFFIQYLYVLFYSIIYRNDFYGLILLFFNDNCIDYALIQKSKILDFKFPAPDQNNQIIQDDKKLFDISNKFFKICELLDEYEVIPIDHITSKILILDFNYKKKQYHYFCTTTFVSDHN